MTRRRDPHSYTRVLLPEADLAELVLELATPLLADLGASPRIEAARRTLDLVITFWNAHVLASKLWERPRLKELNELKKRMRGRNASREDAITFDLLTSRWRKHAAEPRLVESWVYEHDDSGTPRLTCTMCLPEGVKEWRPPPIEARIAIGGRLLDEVRIALGVNQFLTFPVSRHHVRPPSTRRCPPLSSSLQRACFPAFARTTPSRSWSAAASSDQWFSPRCVAAAAAPT